MESPQARGRQCKDVGAQATLTVLAASPSARQAAGAQHALSSRRQQHALQTDFVPRRASVPGVANLADSTHTKRPSLFPAASSWQVLLQVVRAAPVRTVVAPVLLFLVCMGLGTYGVLAGAHSRATAERAAAVQLASGAARLFELQLQQALGPAVTLEMVVQLNPYYPDMARLFPFLSRKLLETVPAGAIQALELAPNLVVRAAYPLQGNEAALDHDLLTDATRYDHVIDVLRRRTAVLTGPHDLRQGGRGLLLRNPVYIENSTAEENFGAAPSGRACPPDLCWQPENGTRLWGLVEAMARLDLILQGTDERFKALEAYGLWTLSYPLSNGSTVLVASCRNISALYGDPITAHVHVPGGVWDLRLSRHGGWQPAWCAGLIVLTAAGSLLLSMLLFVSVAQSQRHGMLLSSMLPQKVITALAQGRAFSEEFKTVTILFSDIVSYTRMVSELRPIEVADILNELYSSFDALVDRHGVYKVETIGDSFMAVGGCPVAEAGPAAAEKVAMMAMDMVEAVAAFRRRTGVDLNIRIGMHSGPAVAAVIGRKMPRYCLFGDTVNTASRMETNSAPARIHVSAATAQLLRASPGAGQAFGLTPRGAIEIKGKGRLETFWLVAPPCPTAAGTLQPPMDADSAAAPEAAAAAAAAAGVTAEQQELRQQRKEQQQQQADAPSLVYGDGTPMASPYITGSALAGLLGPSLPERVDPGPGGPAAANSVVRSGGSHVRRLPTDLDASYGLRRASTNLARRSSAATADGALPSPVASWKAGCAGGGCVVAASGASAISGAGSSNLELASSRSLQILGTRHANSSSPWSFVSYPTQSADSGAVRILVDSTTVSANCGGASGAEGRRAEDDGPLGPAAAPRSGGTDSAC